MTDNTISALIREISIKEQYTLSTALAPSNVTPSQAMLLHYIAKNPGAIQKDIVEIMQRRPATVSTLLKKMENDGLIIREIPANNTRNKELKITTKGQAIVDTFIEAQVTIAQALVAKLTEKQQAELTELLNIIK